MGTPFTQIFVIPGTQASLIHEYTETGRLARLSCNGRMYLEQNGDGKEFDAGFVNLKEVVAAHGLLRHVRAAGESWTEEYIWDAAGRPVQIDGVEVRRDDRSRITACLSPLGDWHYGYEGDQLTRIEGPFGVRHLTHGPEGRPVRVVEGGQAFDIAYSAAGRRQDVAPLPANWHFDELGRLWTITNPDGSVRATYLWDGMACLGRVDGPPGAPLAAVFSLDPTLTSVRVTTREGQTRIPRDAFGESLLAHSGVPGLYGGAVRAGFVYFLARSLDPRTGAFSSPDPFHGGGRDPRRAAGYRGPLLVENGSGGVYAVGQNDPVTFADPTGQISFPYLLSSLTWALQNNWTGWIGMVMTVNLWGCLFSGNLDRFFSAQHISSERLKVGAIQLDGVVAQEGVAWTMQHIVWERRATFDARAEVHCFHPQGEFRPGLYGSLLLVEADEGGSFLLRGALNPGNIAAGQRALPWSRAGGGAEPVVPGSPVPHFPSGGIHFDRRRGLRGPVSGTLTELEPSGVFGIGTIQGHLLLVAPAVGLGLRADDLVLLTDAGANAAIVRVLSAVEAGLSTQIRLAETALGVGPLQIRMRGLGAPTSESLNSGPQPGHLDASGTTSAYAKGDPLRLSQGGSAVGAALIERLEASVQLDAALPGGMSAPLTVSSAQSIGPVRQAVRSADPQILDFPNDPIPAVNETIAVTGGGNTLPVVVTEEAGARQRRVDRDLGSLGATGDSVDWQQLVSSVELGSRTAAPETGPALTYEARTAGTAPASGFLRIEDNAGGLAVRAVTGLVYDSLVLGSSLPGNTANPYEVERFPLRPPDQGGLSLESEQVLALDPTVALEGVALQLHQLAVSDLSALSVGAGLTNAIPGATVSGSTASAGAAAAGANQPTPSQFVLLRQAGALEAALVRRVRLTCRFDRALALSASGLEAVLLDDGGPQLLARQLGPLRVDFGGPPPFSVGDVVDADWSGSNLNQYRVAEVEGAAVRLEGGAPQQVALTAGATAESAQVVEPLNVTSLPFVDVGSNRRRVQMPRFGVGEIVEGFWNAATSSLRVTEVSGTQLTLVNALDPSQPLVDLNLRRLMPIDPGTGGSRAGIEGIALNVAPDGTTQEVRFDVWQPNIMTLTADQRVGIVDGGEVHPAAVDSALAVELEFGAAPGLSGAGVDITIPDLAGTEYSESFRQQGGAVTIGGILQNFMIPSPNLVVAIPFRKTDRQANGELNPGTVLVPEDLENWEVNRWQSLVEHELRHTQQYLWFGPLWFTMFPLWAIDITLAAATDVEMPEFSPFVAGSLRREEDDSRWLTIPDFQGIPFAVGDGVQVSQGNSLQTVNLGPLRNGSQFRIAQRLSLADGDVFVRRRSGSPSAWYNIFGNVMYEIVRFLTPGGLMNSAIALTYGTMYQLLGRLIYLLIRLFTRGDLYDAAVEADGKRLRLANLDDLSHFREVARVIVESGEQSVVRSVQGVAEDGVIELRAAVEFSGQAKVAPYSARTPRALWDWRKYYPATVVEDRPASIQIHPVDGDTLELQPFDRVMVLADGKSSGPWPWPFSNWDTVVTAVSGDIVDLTKPPPTSGTPETVLTLRVAKIGRQDPMGWLDSRLLDEWAELGWVRWITDPFAQLHIRTRPKPGSVGDVFARIARHLLGTSGWSMMPPVFGFVWWDRLFKGKDTDHRAWIEQDASEQSGTLYSPLGRLRGTLEVVGDIGRYWYFDDDPVDYVITVGNQDAPGVHNRDQPRILPFVTAETGAGGLNNGAGAGLLASAPGEAVPDLLMQKNLADPRDAPGTAPRSLLAADRGWIPTSPVLQRASGVYVAFTQPGRHRITAANNVSGAGDARDAQDRERQEIFFERDIADVTVTAAGGQIAEGDTLRLLQTQRVQFNVEPDRARRYAAALLQPVTGQVLRAEDDLVVVAGSQNGSEPVDISRVYRFDPTTNQFDSGGLMEHGLHLPAEVHIPVRRLNVEVVDILPVLAALPNSITTDLYAATPASLSPGGEVFVLVAANVLAFQHQLSYPGSVPPGASLPNPGLADVTDSAPVGVGAFLSGGRAFRLRLLADDPPEEAAELAFEVEVGIPDNQATLSVTIQVPPHFRLRLPAGGHQVARGASLTLRCEDSAGDPVDAGSVVVAPSDGVTTATSGADVTIVVEAGAAPGFRTVLVEAASDPDRKAKRTIEIV